MAADFANIIGADTVVKGRIEGTVPLLVEGLVEGQIALDAHLLVGPSGKIEADVEAVEVTIEGSAAGTVAASERVTIRAGANVTATIHTPALIVEDGAKLASKIEMDVELPAGVSRPQGR